MKYTVKATNKKPNETMLNIPISKKHKLYYTVN